LQADDQHPGSDEVESTTGELARRCSLCRLPIAAQFFTLRGLLLCPECAGKIESKHARPGQRRRAAILGLAAAAVFSALWFLANRSTGRPLSPLAVLAGLVIGMAVHQGSGGRGGLRYQVVAALLVYGAFVVRYVPPIFGGIADSIKNQHGAKLAPQATQDAPATPAPIGQLPPQSGEATKKHISTATPMSQQSSAIATLKAYFVFTLVAWSLVLAAPFVPQTSGLIGILFLAAGMALAWWLNRRVRVLGPFPPSN
jgi:HAMP domain-containing protein